MIGHLHRTRRLQPVLRTGASLGLLAAVLWWIEPHALVAAFGAPEPAWLALALAIGVLQTALSAWRWQLTAVRLGAPLGFTHALREYYLASFLNQVLPGGVMGDAARAWRHASLPGAARDAAWQAVVIERSSGQLALLLVVVASVLASPALHGMPAQLASAVEGRGMIWAGTLAAAAIAVAILVRRARVVLRGLARATQQALLARDVVVRQSLASLLIVASYVAVWLCCMRMIGIGTPPAQAAALVPWVLLAMAIPLSVAGWGIREGAAALVWQAAGLDAAAGVAASVSYGLVVVLSTLPGALVLQRRKPAAHPAADAAVTCRADGP
jgi:uncharacterized membrane protein YbhN (UPF0104 family)